MLDKQASRRSCRPWLQKPEHDHVALEGQRKIFSVRYNGVEYFPAFQFQDGQPHETISRALQLLGDRKSGWQTAFWFTSPNGWLNGRKPAECLNDVDAVVGAAAEEAEPIVG
jgi:hypothetical protein